MEAFFLNKHFTSMKMKSEIKWVLSSYQNLSKEQLFDALEVRQEVFVVEQNCPYQDCDAKDKKSAHLLGYENDILVAYLRIVDPGVSYKEPSIGRVLTKSTARKKGYGIDLMNKAIEYCNDTYPTDNIRISAQEYLLQFYRSLGFLELGDVYLEDDIPHMEMVYTSKPNLHS